MIATKIIHAPHRQGTLSDRQLDELDDVLPLSRAWEFRETKSMSRVTHHNPVKL